MKSTKRRTPAVIVAALLAVACGLFAVTSTSAGAATACVVDTGDYASTPVLAATPTSVTAGSSVEISGTGFPANCDLEVSVDGTAIGTVTTGDDGSFTITWDVPADQAMGDVTATAVAGGEVVASTVISIVEQGPTTTVTPATSTTLAGGTGGTGTNGTGSTLPATGAQIGVLVIGGLVMLAAGMALLMWNRGRRVSTQV